MTDEKGSTFNDSVHGSITLPALCIKIIDTLEFQRMRNLKQLGLAYFVYPGASHNRFEHSLGVCHLAGRMVDQLNINSGYVGETEEEELVTKVEKLCVQIAGLCHDMGHGPFSHSWEGFLEENAKSPKNPGENVMTEPQHPWEHEKCSVQMFEHMIESNQLLREFEKNELREDEIKFIKSLIYEPLDEPLDTRWPKVFLYEIISNSLNGIDVDKWDYFVRDSKYLNLSQSFDHNRLLNTCRVLVVEDLGVGGGHRESGEKHVAYRDKDVPNVWDMFQVRAQLHLKAYQHPVVKILEQMWTDALIAADTAGYTFSTTQDTNVRLSKVQDNPRVWKFVTDHIFYDILNNGEKDESGDLKFAKAQSILRRILNRDMYYQIARVNVKDPSKENVDNKREEMLRILQENYLSPDEYCLRDLKIDMGKMREGDSTPFDNYFFYTKDGSTASSVNLAEHTIFPVDSRQLKRVEIMALCKRGRNGSEEVREKCAEIINKL